MMTDKARLSDDDLVRGTAAGDEEAFTLLYRRCQGRVYRFALQMLGSASLSEEVTQEVFLVLMREARNFDPLRGSAQAFIYGITRNYIMRCLDRERPYVSLTSNGSNGEEAATTVGADFCLTQAASDPLVDLTRAESVGRLRRAVLTLPANYREVVVLCDLNEMSYVEAASMLGCAVGTVRSRLHRGRSLLLAKLRQKKPPTGGPGAGPSVDQCGAGRRAGGNAHEL